MLWNFYAFIQTCLLTLCTMACIHAFLCANKAIPKDIRRLFILLTEIVVLECLETYFDRRLALWTDGSLHYWRIFVSAIGYSMRPMMLHVVMLIMTRNVKWKPKYILLALPSIVTCIICVLAFFTDWAFGYDEYNNFHGGPLRYVMFAMLAVYFVMIFVSAIVNYKKRGSETIVILGIVLLLAFDWILALNHDDVTLHLNLESLSVILYFMYFISAFHAQTMEEKEGEFIDSERRLTKEMLDQSIETLAYTIDAKDKYTRGHSSRVAKYSRMIAFVAGKSEEECREVYLAGLLHDIGKISVDDLIINKPGKLTDEEFDKIKKHPSYGARILKKMKSIPFLQNGAMYHHERYDGKGYPSGLKGEEIPEIARIISVADAYDAMTSSRSYRDTMDQSVVKQEIWKGMGTQFDPLFAKVMISLIDADLDYKMREIPGEQDEIVFDDTDTKIEWHSPPKEQKADITMMQENDANSLAQFIMTEDHWFTPGIGIAVTNADRRVSFHSVTREEASYVWSAPVIIIYSSEDGALLGPGYDELGVFMTAGYGWKAGSTLYEHSGFVRNGNFESWNQWISRNKDGLDYTLDFYIEKNIVHLIINNDLLKMDVELAVPEHYSKNIYLAISGERADIYDIRVI